MSKRHPSKGPWSVEHDTYVAEHYGHMSVKDIAAHVGRTVKAVYQRARELGVARKMDAWRGHEIALLSRVWSEMGIRSADLFPHKTPGGVRAQALRLGLRRVTEAA